MYCPRCGSQNTETTKYCRQCGLSLAHVAGFVASAGAAGTGAAGATGATGALASPPPQPAQYPVQLSETAEMLALKHKRTMTILAMCIAPVVLSILGEELFRRGDLFATLFLLLPLGVMWAFSHYKIQIRRLQEQQLQQYWEAQQQLHQPPKPAPQPLFQESIHQPALPPPTNPFNVANPARGSVIEDETQRFRG